MFKIGDCISYSLKTPLLQWRSRFCHTFNRKSKTRPQTGSSVETANDYALSGVVCWNAGRFSLD